MIRTMRADDLVDVLRIDREVLKSNWSETLYMQELLDLNTVALVSELNGKVIGFVIGKIMVDTSDLFQIAVSTSIMNQGYGYELLSSFWDEVRLKGAREIILEVSAKSTRVIEFYTRFGFRRLYVRKNYYGRNRDAWVMKKEGDSNADTSD